MRDHIHKSLFLTVFVEAGLVFKIVFASSSGWEVRSGTRYGMRGSRIVELAVLAELVRLSKLATLDRFHGGYFPVASRFRAASVRYSPSPR